MDKIIVVAEHTSENSVAQCLWALETFTQAPHEVVLVKYAEDNYAVSANVQCVNVEGSVIVTLNKIIREQCEGDFVLMYAETMVTSHWLERLRYVMEHTENAGAVGPINYISGVFQMLSGEERKQFATLKEMLRIAAEYAVLNEHKYVQAIYLSPLCLLMKRAAYEAVGGLDESLPYLPLTLIGYGVRLLQQGYYSYVAQDIWVHNSRQDNIPADNSILDDFDAQYGFVPTYSLNWRADLLKLFDVQQADLCVMDIM